MHDGRIKPLDTVAREEVKQIYSREMISLTSGGRQDRREVVARSPRSSTGRSGPSSGTTSRSSSVEYLPLKRFILAEAVRAELNAVAAKDKTSEADRARSRP